MHRASTLLAGALLATITACSPLEQVAPLDVALTKGTAFPSVIEMPGRLEGVAIGTGHTFYAGNIVNGTIYTGDLRSGAVGELRTADGRGGALGMKYDDRSGYLFVARGGSGWATVVHGATGVTVAEMQFAVGTQASPTFVNDVVITRTAAYFTDSRRAVMYRVPLGPEGELAGGFDAVPLGGDFVQGGATPCLIGGLPGPLFANGIEATPNGEWLIINSLANGVLYRVDPSTGVAARIDLGADDVCLADGNLLAGRTLYVMQNLHRRIAVVQLSQDYLTGTVERHVAGVHPMTTMGRFGNSIYAVTAGFGFLQPPAENPVPFQVVKLGM